MRIPLVAALALGLLPAPVLAHERTTPRGPDMAELADQLSNPVVQDTVAAVVDQFAATLLTTQVGPLARYADPRDHVRADDTLGQVIARRDPDYAQKLHEQTHDMVRGTGQAAGDAAAMSAELKRTADKLRLMLKAFDTQR